MWGTRKGSTVTHRYGFPANGDHRYPSVWVHSEWEPPLPIGMGPQRMGTTDIISMGPQRMGTIVTHPYGSPANGDHRYPSVLVPSQWGPPLSREWGPPLPNGMGPQRVGNTVTHRYWSPENGDHHYQFNKNTSTLYLICLFSLEERKCFRNRRFLHHFFALQLLYSTFRL